MRSYKRIVIIVLWILSFFLLSSLWGFFLAIKPPRIISKITPHDLGLPYEEITFATRDALNLRGWFIPHSSALTKGEGGVPSKAKTIILLHGYPADKGNILPALAFLHGTYNLFLFDFRYFGKSEGSYSTAGAKEGEDLFAAIRFLKSRGIEEVGVWGFSMGGAVALMAAPRTPEVKAIVSESSYARLDLLAPQLYRFPLLKYPLGAFTRLWGKLLLGIDARDASPVQSAQTLTIPVLLIHSRSDMIIPFSHALLLKKALEKNPAAEFWFTDHLFHGELSSEYEKRIKDFFARSLG